MPFQLGGYNYPNTARLWALCTAVALGENLNTDIPEHKVRRMVIALTGPLTCKWLLNICMTSDPCAQYFVQYGPDYRLPVSPGNRPNENTVKGVGKMLQTISGYLSNLPDYSGLSGAMPGHETTDSS